jgi:hypothetical protein
MLVQMIVRSRPTQHPLQIASVHVPDVVLGPCGYPIIDEGWESAVGLVSEPAAELIIIIVATIIITILMVAIIIIIAMTLTITIVRMTIMIIIIAIVVVVAMVVAAMPLPPCAHVWRM